MNAQDRAPHSAHSDAERINFGGWFQDQLARRGWRTNHFAEVAGISLSLPYKWKENQNRPGPRSCQIIADALSLDLDTVLLAAGHRPRSERAPGIIRSELAALINQVDEVLLAPLVPMLTALTDERTADEVIVRIAARLPGPALED